MHATLTHPWNVLSARHHFPKGRDLVKIPEMKRKQVNDDGNMEDSRRKEIQTLCDPLNQM